MTHDDVTQAGGVLVPESEPLWEIDATGGRSNTLLHPATVEPDEFVPEVRVAVRTAINQLPTAEREILSLIVSRLKSGQEISINALAAAIHLPYATIYGRVGRAMILLHDRLENDPVVQTYLEQHKPDLGLEPHGLMGRLLRSA